ncbi:MAG: hypothetical protein U0Z53_06710 [Blastocatellia bacterium]
MHRHDPPFDVIGGRLLRTAPDWKCYVNERRAWFVVDDSFVVIHSPDQRVGAAQVEIFLNPQRRKWRPETINRIFGCALHAALQPHGLHFLHGAGVVTPDGETGVLIVGASGSGKSTLALRLVISGWRYLTDDLLLTGAAPDNPRGPVLAHAFRRNFSVSEELLARCDLPRLAASLSGVVSSDRTKRWLCPDTLFAGQYAAACNPRMLIFPQLTGAGASRVERMTPPETLRHLLQETPLIAYDQNITRAQIQTMQRLAEQAEAWRLYAGRDLLEEPDCAARLLTGLLSSHA